MIERYTTPDMGRIWSDQNKYATWQKVEITVTEVLCDMGIVPKDAVKVINENWDEVLEAILEIKNISLTLNQNTNIVRIHKKEVIEAQEAYNAKRKAELRKSIEFSKFY